MNNQNTVNTYLGLTIKPRGTILEGIQLNETVDINLLNKLINSSLLKETVNNPLAQIYNNEKKQLEKYKELIENGKAKIIYTRGDKVYGRINPVNALGYFPIRREIRHTLAKNNYIDIDIDNCHPSLLEQILNHNNFECPSLKSYIENRNDWLNFVSEYYNLKNNIKIKELDELNKKIAIKDASKNLFIRIMYGGGVSKWKIDNAIDFNIQTPERIQQFIDEIKNINDFIAINNPNLVEYTRNLKIEQRKMDEDGYIIQNQEEINENKPKRKYNLNGSVSSYFLQEKELMILELIFIFCKENKYINSDNNCVLCADGIMINKRSYKDNILTELKNYIFEKTGFNLNFSKKEMNQDYLKIIDDSINIDLYTPMFTTGMIADYFKMMYSNKFLRVNNNLYVYNGFYWKIENDNKFTSIHNFIDFTFYKHITKYIGNKIKNQCDIISRCNDENDIDKHTKIKNKMILFSQNMELYCRNIKKRTDLVKEIINKITDNNIEFDEDPFLFAFNNKIWDLQNDIWIEPYYNQYISISTGWDWQEYYPSTYKIQLEKLITTIFPDEEVKDYYLIILSTGMYGQQIEKLFIANGRGGNGKSLINGIAMHAYGNYAYKIPSELLLKPLKSGANVEAAGLHKKRFVLAQEPDEKQKMCTSTIKEITGDPTLNSRTLYSTECTVKLILTLILECNDLPKLDTVDDAMLRRIIMILFVSMYVDEDKYKLFTEEEIKENNIFIGNPYYKSDDFKNNYKQAFIQIMFEKFSKFRNNNFKFTKQPDVCREKAMDYLATSDNIYDWFTCFYKKEDKDIKEEDKNVIYISELYDIFKSSEYFQNFSKEDKRIWNLKNFTKKINDNLFLKHHIKKRGTSYNCPLTKKRIQHTKDYITGFKKIDNNTQNNLFTNNNIESTPNEDNLQNTNQNIQITNITQNIHYEILANEEIKN